MISRNSCLYGVVGLFWLCSTATAQVSLHQRMGIVEGEPYPFTNQTEASGSSLNWNLLSKFDLGGDLNLGLNLPSSYVQVDLPGGSVEQHWLIGNIGLFAVKKLILSSGVVFDLGASLNIPTAFGDARPNQDIFINKAQVVSSAISGGSSREVFEPGRTSLVPFFAFDYKFAEGFGVDGFAKVPLMMVVGSETQIDSDLVVVNTLAVHSSFGLGLFYDFFDWFRLKATSRYATYIRETSEADSVASRATVIIEPAVSGRIFGWHFDLGYTAALSGPQSLMSTYLSVTWPVDEAEVLQNSVFY